MKTKMVKGMKRRCYADGGMVKPKTYADTASGIRGALSGGATAARLAQIEGAGRAAPAAAPAAPVPARPAVKLNVKAPEKAAVNTQRRSALQGQLAARLKAAEESGNTALANELRDAMGGGFNKGGKVPGRGNKDTVPAMLTPGEVVMSKPAVEKYGAKKLLGMNARARRGLQRRARR